MITLLVNSVIVGLVSTILALIIAFAICYPITRLPISRRTRAGVMNWALSLRFLAPIAVVIPYFTIVRTLGIYNQLPALILVYTIFNLPLAIWMLKGFLQEIPLEIEEAAMVDGGSRWQAFRSCSCRWPDGVLAAGIIVFAFDWAEFLFAFILTATPQAQTFPVGVAGLVTQFEIIWNDMAAGRSSRSSSRRRDVRGPAPRHDRADVRRHPREVGREGRSMAGVDGRRHGHPPQRRDHHDDPDRPSHRGRPCRRLRWRGGPRRALLDAPDEVREAAAIVQPGEVWSLNGIQLQLGPDGRLDRERLEAELTPRLEICRALGAAYLLVVPPRAPRAERAPSVAAMRDGLTRIRDAAATSGRARLRVPWFRGLPDRHAGARG